MDLSILILGTIGFVGYKLNDKKQPRNKKKIRKDVSPHDIPSGKNIYRSTYSKENASKERVMANKRYQKSKNPEKTGIIPPMYNTYCKWDCDDSGPYVKKELEKENTILPSVKLSNSDKRKKQILEGPMFKKEVFGQIESSNLSDIKKDEPQKLETECFKNISTLSGQYTDMHHNNMMPFFGSSVRQNTKIDANSSILENFTGQGVDTKIIKSEVPKMFENNKENIYGVSNYSDNVSKNRFIVSDLKTNLLPTPQIKVQPLPEEYVRPVYKTTNQLRIATNPKNEYEAKINHGKRYVTNRGKFGKFDKNRPETFYNNDIDRYLTTTGATSAPTYRETINLKCTPKALTSEKSLNVSAPYNSSLNKGKPNNYIKISDVENRNSFYTAVQDDKRQTYKSDWVRNVKGDVTEYDENNKQGYVAYEQERETTNRLNLLPASDTNRSYHQSAPNELKATNKENNLYSHLGNAASEVQKITDYTGAYNYTKEKQAINNPYYKGTPSRTNIGKYDNTQYKNVSNYGNRENIMDKRGYIAGGQKENIVLGSDGVKAKLKDDTLGKIKYEYNANVHKIFQEPINKSKIGETRCNDTVEKDVSSRINPELLDAFRHNPYTKSLHSI